MKRNTSIGVAIGVIAAVLVAELLFYAKTRPNEFRVQRSAMINAPAERIFPLLADFHRWGEWSPYETRDPAMTRAFGGARSGRGAIYVWQGNYRAGSGRMQIAEATPPSKLRIQLDFAKPIEGHNLAEFTLVPHGEATEVTWSIHGWRSYIGKVVGVFVNVEKGIDKDFEAGLANLKALAERTERP